jgi:hypothetical protein
MSLGLSPRQQDMFATTTGFCESLVAPDSIYGLLHRECHRLFPDEMFADLFCDVGRRCVPPMIVAVVMVLQRLEGCSDREAVERFTFDARWKYAAGGLEFDYPGFVHTVLVDMRARLAGSEQPDRIFEVTLDAARRAGLVGRRRVLDSTPLYDAVATMDTVTLVRSAIRGLLAVCGPELESELRGLLVRDDDYRRAGKPVCDYDDPHARQELIDALAKDARALLVALDGRELGAEISKGRRRCWRRSWAKTSTRTRTGSSESREGSRRTGSSRPATPTRGKGTRPRRAGLMGTRVQWRTALKVSWSSQRRSVPATLATPAQRASCSQTTSQISSRPSR